MDEEEKRRITWFANKLVKKNVQLPFLRRPASGDQFSTLIESVDHLLTESHRRRELLLPELTAFNNKSVGVFSDYSGEGSGRYNVYSILVCGMNMTSGFHDAVTKVRSEHALVDKEISFKDLNMGQIRRALPSYLEAANHLPGLLYTVAIEKGIRSVFGSEPDTPKKIVKLRQASAENSGKANADRPSRRIFHSSAGHRQTECVLDD